MLAYSSDKINFSYAFCSKISLNPTRQMHRSRQAYDWFSIEKLIYNVTEKIFENLSLNVTFLSVCDLRVSIKSIGCYQHGFNSIYNIPEVNEILPFQQNKQIKYNYLSLVFILMCLV